MIDRGKVIKGLTVHLSNKVPPCDECPYANFEDVRRYNDPSSCSLSAMADALTLLKEQEPKEGHWIFESRYNDIWSNICSECGRLMTTATGTYANYCSNCGAKMMGGEKKDDID